MKTVADVKRVAEVLASDSDAKPKSRGEKAQHGVSKKAIAEAIGTSKTAIVEAEQHVETAEAFPFMPDLLMTNVPVSPTPHATERVEPSHRAGSAPSSLPNPSSSLCGAGDTAHGYSSH